MPDGDLPPWRNPQPLIEAIALLRGKTVELTPDLPGSQLKSQLPLFLTQATGEEERQLSAPPPRFVLFVLTDGNGRQLFVYAVVFGCAAGEVAALCVVSRARCYPTPFRDVLVHLLRTASPSANGDATAAPGTEASLLRVLRALPCLVAPTPRVALRLELPRGGGGCVFGAPTAGHPPPADAMMWDLLHCVGVDGVLTLWHALLLERSVLLVSDTPALLGASCEALRALLHPLRWECTYVPLLPRSLLAFLEAPTPFLMATQRRFLAERAAELDTAAILVADLDYGRLRYGAAFGKLPPLPRDPLPYLAPLPPLLHARAAATTLGPAARDVKALSQLRNTATAQYCFLRLLAATLQPAALRSAINARPGAAALERCDWDGYARAQPSKGQPFYAELRGTQAMSRLVEDMSEGSTLFDHWSDGAPAMPAAPPPVAATLSVPLADEPPSPRTTTAEGLEPGGSGKTDGGDAAAADGDAAAEGLQLRLSSCTTALGDCDDRRPAADRGWSWERLWKSLTPNKGDAASDGGAAHPDGSDGDHPSSAAAASAGGSFRRLPLPPLPTSLAGWAATHATLAAAVRRCSKDAAHRGGGGGGGAAPRRRRACGRRRLAAHHRRRRRRRRRRRVRGARSARPPRVCAAGGARHGQRWRRRAPRGGARAARDLFAGGGSLRLARSAARSRECLGYGGVVRACSRDLRPPRVAAGDVARFRGAAAPRRARCDAGWAAARLALA